MVKVKRKPLEEIAESVKGYTKILNVGCGGCVSVCLAGGQREVKTTNAELTLLFEEKGINSRVDGYTVERQCNAACLEELDDLVVRYDCLLSMACGAGVQMLAERYPSKPVFPAQNTVAIGVDREIGVYEEKCRACGRCVLAYTGGIWIPCAWNDIYIRLKQQNRLDDIKKIHLAMEWQNSTPRTIVQPQYEHLYAKEEK
ncbi:MAG: hypothetical protein B5M56_04325 [Desulfococcus sp. 4484_241]|nr:MAG: hypothetical protein B5M56_04325 [Desulfococcus sp. 4484_241]